ncbi:zinc finger and BTB domain-containing protein 26 isoform X1 [Etheostoma spectabile]|uniref:zinc finger and BTB domain-containing protein 26 isoform X1 n=1 Tax=Etheostoma spectabile TaxID=54343 RepID=UPI0013AF9E14|nr:zinc finger and BTB domain-containing protein 26-like isoform X1 [Etheostoma spectabile]
MQPLKICVLNILSNPQTSMSSSSETLQFCFPTHGDSILSKINTLREEQRFCDITLLLGGTQSAPVQQPLHFHGHRAVLAASSDFLRDQFLLHEDRAELSLGVVSSVEVGKRLLLSCYTGLLEVPLREVVSYLTAASALQMSQVVEKCSQAVSQYLSPTLVSLKLERHSEKAVQQPDSDWPNTSFKNQEERDAARPSNSIQEAISKGGPVGSQSKSRCSQGVKGDGQGLREVRDDARRVVLAKIELTKDAESCLGTLESEEGEAIQPVHTNKPSHQVGLRCKLHPPAAGQDQISSTTRGSSAQHKELGDTSQDKDAEEKQKEEEETLLLADPLQECGELMDSNRFRLSGAHLPNSNISENELTEDSGSILVQRPYLCRRCDRVFQHLESYVGHLKKHREYLCLVCGKGFFQKSYLTRHIRDHTGVKPFRCPLCHKTFSQKAMLQGHLNLQTGHKPHNCKYCAVHFAHKPSLRRHLKDIHGKLEETVH